jgi:hypothetical protein
MSAGATPEPSGGKRLWAQTVAAVAIVVWRVAERDLTDLPRDLPLLLSLFWLSDLHVKHPRVREWLTPLAVLGLFAAYALRQLDGVIPHLRFLL